MHAGRRLLLFASSGLLLALTAACAAAPCPEGWQAGTGSECLATDAHRNAVRARIGDTGALGIVGHQGTGAPPTGAGGGFQPWAQGSLLLDCQSTSCTDVAVTTDTVGRWEAALEPGRFCATGHRGSPFVGDGGTTTPPPPRDEDCFDVVDGQLTEVQLSDL